MSNSAQDNSLQTVILGASQRIVRNLRLAWHQRRGEQASWQIPQCSTLQPWLATLIEDAILSGEVSPANIPRRVLSALQERELWRQVIAQSLRQQDAADLFDINGLAQAAVEANSYVVAWRLTLNHAEISAETAQFIAWQNVFRQRCQALNVLEKVRYFDWQLNILQNTQIALPSRVEFAGFDHIAPQEQRLREILQQRGVAVSAYPTVLAKAGNAQLWLLEDETDELRHIAGWVQQQMQQHPQPRLAIVVPDLKPLRQALANWLDDVLHPHTMQAHKLETPRLYDFSLGTPLSEHAIVAAALRLVRWFTQYQYTQEEFAQAWLAPHWAGGVKEADARAQFDAHLREHLPKTLTLKKIMAELQKKSEIFALSATGLALTHSLECWKAQPRQQAPSAWMQAFRQLLQQLAWAGERALDSHEYQAVQRFWAVLDTVSGFDLFQADIHAGEALRLLQTACQEAIFQPETLAAPAIQIMGMMEALSAPVDALWVMGMNDEQWPSAPRPNPLLPAALQRAAGVANADSKIQMAFAQRIHQRLLHAAPQIIFSASRRQGERMLRVSPLMDGIAPYSDATAMVTPAVTLAEQLAAQAQAKQWLADHIAPAVQDNEHISGGTALLRAQAICPAWAFYRYRLHAKALRMPKDGLDNAERGQLTHSVLEYFWRTQDNTIWQPMPLKALSDVQINTQLHAIASHVLQQFMQDNPSVLSAELAELEAARLVKLVAGWLAHEKSREIPFRVVECEKHVKINLQGIALNLFIDRVDVLQDVKTQEDGNFAVIDYKTGRKPELKNWAHTRITEPQLPVYLAFANLGESATPSNPQQQASPNTDPQAVQTACFAMVKLTDYAFFGVSAQPVVDGVNSVEQARWLKNTPFTDWQSLLEHWRQSLLAMVDEIKAGESAVRFENADDLAYCEVLPILRLPERQLQFENAT